MKKNNIASFRKIFDFILRTGVGVLFVVSGIAKFSDVHMFRETIGEFGVTSIALSTIFSYMVPMIETIAGACLIIGFRIRFSSGAIMLLLLVFIAFIIPILVVGKTVDCGCFGSLSSSQVDVMFVIRDVVLFGATLVVWSSHNHVLSIDSLVRSLKKDKNIEDK